MAAVDRLVPIPVAQPARPVEPVADARPRLSGTAPAAPRPPAAAGYRPRTVGQPALAVQAFTQRSPAGDGRAGDAPHLTERPAGGSLLPPALRGRVEQATGQDLGDVRVHVEDSAVSAAGARAATVGTDIALAPGQAAPEDAAAAPVLLHEVGHVLQQLAGAGTGAAASPPGAASEDEADRLGAALLADRPVPAVTPVAGPVVQRLDGPVCEPHQPIATFVLDPALDVTPPANVTTHVRVTGPLAAEGQAAGEQHVQFDRPVRRARTVRVVAVPLREVFDDEAEAASAGTCDPLRPLPQLAEGDQAWTVSASFPVTGTWGDLVFTDRPVPEAAGAAVVTVVETDAGLVLLDSGLQVTDRALADPLGEEVARRLLLEEPSRAFGEAALLPGAPDGHVLPVVARHVAVGEVRVTSTQYADRRVRETVEAVQRSAASYRQWLEQELRWRLDQERSTWEGTQPIAPNRAVREQRWQHHVQRELARLLGEVPRPTVMLAEEQNGLLRLTGGPVPAEPVRPPGALVDLTGTAWEPVDDELILVIGDGQLHLLDARGLLLRPVRQPSPQPAPPGPVTVPGLRPSGPTGPVPLAARPATPWLAVPTVGKSAQVLARTGEGPGVLIDAGGAQRFLPERAIAEMITRLGVTTINTILVTHGHADHISVVQDTITRYGIEASRVVISAHWAQAQRGPLARVLRALRATTDANLLRLGYGPDWRPGIPLAESGIARATVRVAGGEVEVLARGEAQAEFAAAARRGGPVPSHVVDSASLLYVLGNPTSPHRAAVLGDLRGEDILAFSRDLGPGGLGRALAGVRVLIGFGHHLGLDAGSSPDDVRGYELLFRETLLRNGELTIVVQSTESFSGDNDPARAARGRALLDFATGMGARVVFAGEPGATGPGSAVVSSDLTVLVHGSGVTLHEGDPRVTASLERLRMLREARRTLVADPELGARHLRLTRPVTEVLTGLEAEIGRLEALYEDLLGRRAADLLDARAENTSVRTRADFRAERSRSALSVEQLHAQLAERGPVEAALPADVVAGLRAAVQHGSALAVEAELSAVPRGVAEAVARLPEARRAGLERLYGQMQDDVASLRGDDVPGNRRLLLQARAQVLRTELLAVASELSGESRLAVDAEVRRLDTVIARLGEHLVSDTVTGRDVEGRLTRTEYRAARRPDGVDRGFAAVGQVLGGLMVVHSVQGLAQTAASAQRPDVNVPETLLRTTHDVHGMTIGIRMLRMQHVHPGEFVALALLEVGAAAAGDYSSSEERDYAVLRTTLHSSVNLLCLAAGTKVMGWGAAVPHPVGRAAAMGLGLAITLAGEPLLRGLDLDDDLVRLTSFAPSEVTRVHQEIQGVLDEYELLVGGRLLAERSDAELAALGARDLPRLRAGAGRARERAATAAREKERALMSLFEAAYRRAAVSYTGLRSLDALAARFSRLRHVAMRGGTGQADLQARFLALDAALDLSDLDPASIRGMEQWSELQDKLSEVDEALSARPVDWAELFEQLDEAQQMIENARYRVDPAPEGLRPTPMIRSGTRAHGTYVELLTSAEMRLAGLLRRAAVLGAQPGAPVDLSPPVTAALASTAVDPRAALARLQALRVVYDERVREGVAAFPALSNQETWSDSFQLGGRLEQAHRARPELFHRLRLTETSLRVAVGQARAAVATTEVDAELRGLVEREAASAERAFDERRVVHGLVLPHELDLELARRRAAEDRLLAAAIDAAYPGQVPGGASPPTPLSDEEIRLLGSDELAPAAGPLTSTSRQLARAWDQLSPMRSLDLTTPRLDYAQMSRLERQLLIITGPTFWTFEQGWIDDSTERDLPRDRVPLVARIGGDVLGAKGWFSGPHWYARVLAVNADAVALLGSEPVLVAHSNLRRVTPDDIRARARQAVGAP